MKKIIESKIMGWFPQEPCQIIIGTKEDNENEQHPLVIPSGYNLSTTLIARLTAVFWAILGSILIIPFLSFERNVSFPFQVTWIIAGLAVGIVSGLVGTKNQLGRLSKDRQLNTNKKDLIILIFPLFLLFMIGQFISVNYVGLRTSALLGDLCAVFAFAVIVQVIRYGIFSAFEKKEKVCFLQSSFRGRVMITEEN